jgi:hypothetical protein
VLSLLSFCDFSLFEMCCGDVDLVAGDVDYGDGYTTVPVEWMEESRFNQVAVISSQYQALDSFFEHSQIMEVHKDDFSINMTDNHEYSI